MSDKQAEFSDLVGKTMVSVVNRDNEEIIFTTDSGETYRLWHYQECCESVTVDDICGELSDLVGAPILKAEESNSNENPPGITREDLNLECFTWTFYHVATIKGYVTIRWYGASNGCYSESVDFQKV